MKLTGKEQRLLDQRRSLKRRLDENNVGFRMLKKMGWKPEDSNESNPLSLEMRGNKKTGIGFEAEDEGEKIERRVEEYERSYRDQVKRVKDTTKSYVKQQSDSFQEKQMKQDVKKMRAACAQLDQQNGREWSKFWPETEAPEVLHEDDQTALVEFGELSVTEQMDQLNAYLRGKYFYCIWCAAAFDDEEQLTEECPGDSAAAHDE